MPTTGIIPKSWAIAKIDPIASWKLPLNLESARVARRKHVISPTYFILVHVFVYDSILLLTHKPFSMTQSCRCFQSHWKSVHNWRNSKNSSFPFHVFSQCARAYLKTLFFGPFLFVPLSFLATPLIVTLFEGEHVKKRNCFMVDDLLFCVNMKSVCKAITLNKYCQGSGIFLSKRFFDKFPVIKCICLIQGLIWYWKLYVDILYAFIYN